MGKQEVCSVLPGMLVYVEHEQDMWTEGSVVHVTGEQCTVIMHRTQETKQCPVSALLPRSEQCLREVSNLTDLAPITEASVLCCLAERFGEQQIYTSAGSTVVAVNPFRTLADIYSHSTILKYNQHQEDDPHIYRIGNEAYTNMCRGLGQIDQCIIVSGESGSGKTVSAKHLLKFMTVVSNSTLGEPGKITQEADKSIEERILDSNPILEAFGNAVTQRNDNSSRFGKFIQLQFSRGGQMLGAEIQTYLLEKTRVVHQSPGEANFHIFYQIMDSLLASGDTVLGQLVQDLGVEAFRALPRGKAISSNRDFKETLQAMTDIGIPEQVQGEITKVLVAILFLCNVEITPLEEELCQLLQDKVSGMSLEQVADLLGLEKCHVEQVLLYRNIESGGNKRRSVFVKPVPQREAYSHRDCLATLLYSRLFDWLVGYINRQICTTNYDHTIGLLDIYGFEAFEKNSLEQLCINYANEKLQQHYISHFLKDLQREYEEECIPWQHISYSDNQGCLNLLDSQPSVFGLLNEDVKLNRQTNTELLCGRILELSKSFSVYIKGPCNYLKSPGFTICHYAGEVTYMGEDLTTKNRDNIPQELVVMLQGSSNTFVSSLFENFHTDSGGTGQRKKTVLSKFKASLDVLMSSINTSDVHYIRCIKPNTRSVPDVFDRLYVMSQLRAGGIIETVKISSLGYPVRMPYSLFLKRYGIILRHSPSPPASQSDQPVADDTDTVYDPLDMLYRKQLDLVAQDSPRKRNTPKRRLRRRAGLSSADHTRRCSAAVLMLQFGRLEHLTEQFGRTKLFLHQHQIDSLEETRYNIICQKASIVQHAWRQYRQRLELERHVRKERAASRIQAAWRHHQRQCSKAVIIIQKTFRMYRVKLLMRKLKDSRRRQRKRKSSDKSWKPILDCKRTSPGSGRSSRGQSSADSSRSDVSGSGSAESLLDQRSSVTLSVSQTIQTAVGKYLVIDNEGENTLPGKQFTTSTPRADNKVSKSRKSGVLTSHASQENISEQDRVKKNPRGRPDMSKYSPVQTKQYNFRIRNNKKKPSSRPEGTKQKSADTTNQGEEEGGSPRKRQKLLQDDESACLFNLRNGILSRRALPTMAVRFHTRASVLKYAHYRHQKELPSGLTDCLSPE